MSLLLSAGRVRAADGQVAHRPMADLDDVKAVAPAVLRHRLVTNFSAEAADQTSESLVTELMENRGWAK